MSRRNLVWMLALPATVAVCLALAASPAPPSEDYKLVRTIVDVLAEVDKNYVRPLTPDEKRKLVEDMINGGLEKLDPYSQYFSAAEFEQFNTQTEGEYGGVGILLKRDVKSRFLQVESPIPGSPAYDAGVRADDLILKIGDRTTEDLRIEDARKLIKGPAGTAVTLTFLRDIAAGPFEVPLKRQVIELHAVGGAGRDPADPTKWDYVADKASGVALVRLIQFSEKTERELTAAIAEARKQGARSLVLDLRENPGGLLGQAVKVADLFLAGGPIVTTEDRRGGGRQWAAAAGDAGLEDPARLPMAVLVNSNSASAAEIVAAALQDNKRAAVVGERSYGKGSVQRVYPLDGGAAVKLTGEQWLRAGGGSIHRWPDSKPTDAWGVKPDAGLEVPLTDADRKGYYDHLRALEVIPGKPGAGAAEKKASGFRDPVLAKAVEHLAGKK